MREDASDKNRVRDQVGKIRDVLGDPRLQDVIERAAAQVPGDEAPRDKIATLLSTDVDSQCLREANPRVSPTCPAPRW